MQGADLHVHVNKQMDTMSRTLTPCRHSKRAPGATKSSRGRVLSLRTKGVYYFDASSRKDCCHEPTDPLRDRNFFSPVPALFFSPSAGTEDLGEEEGEGEEEREGKRD